jgi:POT family proton-dependent oligopeptide transporter
MGNGLFKPNISAMVGNLYEDGDPRRDAGFNIFYMGINIGAATSALLSVPFRNAFNFNFAFMMAGVGLLIGVTILTLNWKKLEKADRHSEPDPDDITFGQVMVRIIAPAAVAGLLGYWIGNKINLIVDTIGGVTFGFLVGMLPIMGYFITLWVKAKPDEKAGIGALIPVFVAGGTFFMILHLSGGLMTIYAEHDTDRRQLVDMSGIPLLQQYVQQAMPTYFVNAQDSDPRPVEEILVQVPEDQEAMFGARRMTQSALNSITAGGEVYKVSPNDPRVLSNWSFLATHIYPDDNIEITKTPDSHGVETVSVKVSPAAAIPLEQVVLLKDAGGQPAPALLVTAEAKAAVYAQAGSARLEPTKFLGLVNAEIYTALFNPVFVVLLTPVVVFIFGRLVKLGYPVSTARKIFIGMLLTTASLLIMVWSAKVGGNGAVKVSAMWLIIYYLVITFGELCLSPMGLSLVTKLAPKRYVGLMMGGWFLSTAVGNKLSGFISGLAPTASMFFVLSMATLAVALFILVLLPRLDRAIKQYGG